MILDESESDSASEDSDFSADEDSDDDDSSASEAELCAEYRPHVQNRELGDTWEDEAKASKVAQGRRNYRAVSCFAPCCQTGECLL